MNNYSSQSSEKQRKDKNKVMVHYTVVMALPLKHAASFKPRGTTGAKGNKQQQQ